MVDTLDIYNKLTAAGIEPKHAEAITRAIAFTHLARSNDCFTKSGQGGRSELSRNKIATAFDRSTASITLALQQIQSNLQKSIKRSTLSVIRWIVLGHIAMLIVLVVLVISGAIF